MEIVDGGQLEKPSDAGSDVKRWIKEINLAGDTEKKWRKRADEVEEAYDSTKEENSFNILWANIEVLLPNVYNSTPKPDVRRRFTDADPVGKQVSEVLKRCISYQLDAFDFDDVITSAILDMLLPGRGVARLCYAPEFESKQADGEAYDALKSILLPCKQVKWRDFRRGFAQSWEDMPWIAYRHLMTTDEFKEKFPKTGAKPDYTVAEVEDDKADKEPHLFKRHMVWEIWDKKTRKIMWVAENYQDDFLLVEDDKLGLPGFFDTPRPLYAVKRTKTLVPKDEYSYYENQAKELDSITQRINRLTKALKVRGVYDATMVEVATLLKAGDNEMIASDTASIAMKEGGLDRAFWFMPIEQIAKVLAQLYINRDQIKSVIYEIVGIADIMRGSSDPTETLGAQQLKTQTGSVRMRHRQKEVQRYVRDLFEMMAEVMAKHFPPELLSQMANMPVTPEMQQMMQNSLLMTFRVDVETDSTIAGDKMADRAAVTEMIQGIGGFVQGMTPAVEAGVIPIEAAKEILLAAVRRFDFGNAVEDAIENAQLQAQQQQGQPQPPSPEAQAQQAQANADQQKAQLDAQKLQMDAEAKAKELELKQAEIQQKGQIETVRLSAEQQIKLAELQLKERELALKEREMALKEKQAEDAQENNAHNRAMSLIQHEAEGERAASEMDFKKASMESKNSRGADAD